MNEKKLDTLITGFSRRSFLSGLLLGGGSVMTGEYFLPSFMSTSSKNVVETMPRFDSFPITHWNDCYLLFMSIGQTLLPHVRRLAKYQKSETDIFKAVWEINFFLYANDFAARFQKHYGDPTLVRPHDSEVAEKYLAESISTYPKAWSQIIFTMLTHSPEVLLDYLSQEKS